MEIKNNLFESVKCNLCGADDYDIIFKSKHGKVSEQELVEKFRSSGDETLIDQVVKCNKCGFVYINPRIKSELVVKGYTGGSDENFVSQARGREMTFAKCLDSVEKYKKKGRILDIGTAGGSFLKVAKGCGWDAHGIEPNKWLGEWGKKQYGVDIKQGTIHDHKFPDNYFDVITLWDVLEHVPDPKKELLEVRRILKDDGFIFVNYPDIGSWIAKLMGRRWVFWLSIHLFYFTPRTMKMMLKKTGFRFIKKKPHIQRLALGYLVFRTKAYSRLAYNVGKLFVRVFHAQKWLIPYWLGQTLVVARKAK